MLRRKSVQNYQAAFIVWSLVKWTKKSWTPQMENSKIILPAKQGKIAKFNQ